MTYISRCEHGTPMALCQKCFPDVSEHNDWSNYKYTHPVKEQEPDLYSEDGFPLWTSPQFKELTDKEIDEISKEVWERPWLEVHRKFARAILRKAQEK